MVAGHSYTLTLGDHDDNAPFDPTYANFDDVAFESTTFILTTSSLTVGSHNITAAYNGDALFLPSASATYVQVVTAGDGPSAPSGFLGAGAEAAIVGPSSAASAPRKRPVS